jgi:hypothetical protein
MLSTLIIVLLVVIFIITFVMPLAKQKSHTEGFATTFSTDPAVQSQMSKYKNERTKMINFGNRQYNRLGSSLDPLLPSFAVAPTRIDEDNNMSENDYLRIFNRETDAANKKIFNALANPDLLPSVSSTTNLGVKPINATDKLPAANDVILQARKCESKLNGRDSCSMLDDPNYSNCGVCIDAGTQYDGKNDGSFIGGLLSLLQDREDAKTNASSGTPNYYPSLGKCPPGMFYVDSSSCKKAVNQLNCTEIGNSGGFQGGRTREGKSMPAVTCAQAPSAGTNTYLYQPPNKKYTAILRFLTPFGTGITKVVVTHRASGNTYTADNNGVAGQEFILELPNVVEADDIDIMVAQEQPHRRNGKAEVFFYKEKGATKYTQEDGKRLCSRIGTSLATAAQVNAATKKGLQAGDCASVSDNNNPYFAVQSGTRNFIGIGSKPSSGPSTFYKSLGAWCYGFKPARTPLANKIEVELRNFFDSFRSSAQPAQGPSIYSQYTTPVSLDPPGSSERAILIQWEMEGSKNRTVGFQATINKVNGYPATSVLRMLGPFNKSSRISGPAWTSSFNIQKNEFWLWSNSSKAQSVVFSVQVPGYLEDPHYQDDIMNAPMGPLITNPKTMDLLRTSPCFAEDQKPGAYSIACLLMLFQGAGGDPAKGKLATEKGGLSQLNALGDISDIISYLETLYLTATTGKDSNGDMISLEMNTRIAAMNDAAQKMFGFDITNPCEDIVDNEDGSVGLIPKPMGSVTPDCLQYLWLNNVSDKDRSSTAPPPQSLFTSTYTSIADRFSGLRYTESTAKRRSRYPFQACSIQGTMAPIKNGEPDMGVIGQLTSMDNLQSVQNFFNGIHKAANYTKGPQDAGTQANAMQMCYGVNQAPNPVKTDCSVLPIPLTTVALWLDAADISTVTVEGSSVTQWADKSGKGNNMSSVSAMPSYNNAGTSSYINFTSGAMLQTSSRINMAPNSIVYVVSQTTEVPPAGLGYVFGCTDMHGAGDFSIRFFAPNVIAQWDTNDMGCCNSPAAYYINGDRKVNGQKLTVPTGFNVLGASINDSGSTRVSISTQFMSRFFIGNIQEVIVINPGMADSDRQKVEGYLAWKWGLQTKLPRSHPYASQAPVTAAGEDPLLAKYKLYAGSDAAGLDIQCFPAGGMKDVLAKCESDPKCVAFITATTPQDKITFGCTKYGVNQDGLKRQYAGNAVFKTVDTYVKQ